MGLVYDMQANALDFGDFASTRFRTSHRSTRATCFKATAPFAIDIPASWRPRTISIFQSTLFASRNRTLGNVSFHVSDTVAWRSCGVSRKTVAGEMRFRD